MTSLFWVLIFACASLQVTGECEQLLTNTNEVHKNLFQRESTCHSSIVCTTCVKKSYVENFIKCTGSNGYCFYETTPQSWESGCSLTRFYNSLPYWRNISSMESTYWYPARRNVDYGPYEFNIEGPSYGTNVVSKANITTDDVKNVFMKNCLILDGKTEIIVPEYCMARHKHNCSITTTELRRFCGSSCVRCSDTHYCVTRNSYCMPDVGHTACETRLKRKSSCLNDVFMVLSFSDGLHLTIYEAKCLSNGAQADYVYCFTDAGEQLKKRVSVKIVFNQTSSSNYIVYQVSLEDYMGQYWCEAADDDGQVYKSNKIVAFKYSKGHEFSVRLMINDVCNYTDCNNDVDELDFVIDDVRDPIEKIGFGIVRLMKVIEFYNSSFADIIIHVSTLSRKRGILGDFYKLRGLLNSYPAYIKVLSSRSSERCLPDSSFNLTWPMARRFETVLPSELCVQSDGQPLRRLCEGDFTSGLQWRPIISDGCVDSHAFNEETLMLQSFLNQTISKDMIYNVSDIVHNGNLTLIDLYFVSQILVKSAEQVLTTNLLNASLDVVNGLLRRDSDMLMEAQEVLNVTDSYLRASETIAVNFTESYSELLTLEKDHVILHAFNPVIENASGFVLYKNHSIKNIALNEDFHYIQDIDAVKLALYVPSVDIQTILDNNQTNVSIVAMIYLNDRLFPSNISSTADLVVNLNIPNYQDYLQSPIPVLINSEGNSSFSCAFWDYGDSNTQKRGNWSSFGSSYDGTFNSTSNLQVCSYSHLTHLALLVVVKENDTSLEGANGKILSLITALGSLVSLLGILGIFITSCLFRSWRDKTGTQILLHLSIATALEIVFMYLNGIKMFECPVAGCILQYVIISKFAWMLVYAYCQHLRFVKVFGPLPNHLVMKSIFFGWGLGILPTVAVVASDPNTYYRERFCYPKDLGLYLGLYLPVALILVVNVWVFFKIMCEVTKNQLDKVHSPNLRTQHIKLAVLLFSVLGIPWCFGLLSNVMPFDWLKTIFLYIFTIASIIQGLLMFLFYVIFNKETKEAWKRALSGKKKTYKMFTSKKSSSSVTSIT